MYIDYSGEFPWHIVIGAVIGGAIGGVSTALSGGDTIDVLIGVAGGILVVHWLLAELAMSVKYLVML